MKKFFALLLVVTTLICPMNAFAKDGEVAGTGQIDRQVTTAIAENVASTYALGKVLASGAGTIHGTGTITVYLPSGNWWADFVAHVTYTSESGMVSCSVRTPEGKTFELGDIYNAGGQTTAHQETYAPAGNYTFYFLSTISEYNVTAFIHD